MSATAATSDNSAPLAGLRVLEIAPPCGGAVGRYLAELGADVLFAAREEAAPDPLTTLVSNTGKRALRLDPLSPEGRNRALDLAADADILIETRLDSAMPPWLDTEEVADLRQRNPRLVRLALSPFGASCTHAGWQMTSSVIDALSGVLSRSGFPKREPVLPPADISLQCAFAQAAWVVLLAYFLRLRSGMGDNIDLSLVEAAAQALDPGFGIAGSATAGVPASKLPRGRPDARHQYPFLPCKDGFVRICVLAPRQWQGLFEWMGRPEKYADPEYNKLHARFRSPTLLPDIAALFAVKSRAELEKELAAHNVPMAPVLTLAEAIETEHQQARKALTRIDAGDGTPVSVPNGIFEIDAARCGVGASAREVDAAAGWLDPVRFDPAPEATAPERPLSGLTVLDFGVIVAGAEQSRLLADQGARTLKLETRAFPDGGRQSMTGDLVSISFAMGHRNKQGLGLNLRDPRGRALFLDLARKADVITSNFKPGTLASLGLDYAAVSAVNPGIVMADSSAYGTSGPWSGRAGYGPLVRASSGLVQQWAYPGADGEFSDAMTVYPDHVSGRIVALATLALLVRRMRTGLGGESSLAQSEVITLHLAEQIAAASMGQERPIRPDAPWGVYPCAGDDEWCVVTVRHDADWQALCRTIGRKDLLARADLAAASGRLAAQTELDEVLSAWTAPRESGDLMEVLQEAGVPAAKMLRVFELPEFAFYQERGAFAPAGHPLIEHPFHMENSIGRSEQIADPTFAPAPLQGEHTDIVMHELLGLDAQTIRELHDAGVLESLAR